VSIISCKLYFIERHVQFTLIPFKPLFDQGVRRYSYLYKFFMNNVVIQNKKRSEKNVQKKTFRKKTTALDHSEKLKIIQLFKNKRKKQIKDSKSFQA